MSALREVMIYHRSGGRYDLGWLADAENYANQHGVAIAEEIPANVTTYGPAYTRSEASVIGRALATRDPANWHRVISSRAARIVDTATGEFSTLALLDTHEMTRALKL